jgi:DNA-directed RNA polymerase specialized sigma24 family protein
MHAPFESPLKCEPRRTWRGGVNGQHYFDSARARAWIEEFNRCGDMEAINELLRHVEPLAKSILEYRCTNRYESVDELLSQIRIKLWRSARLYDRAKGSAFSFVSRIIQSVSYSAVSNAWARSECFCELNEESSSYPCTPDAGEAVADIETRVRLIKTPTRAEHELAAQRWLVASLLDCGFRLRRHEAGNAMMEVFGVDYVRSRWLYDMTLVALRREFIADRRLLPVNVFLLSQVTNCRICRKMLEPSVEFVEF